MNPLLLAQETFLLQIKVASILTPVLFFIFVALHNIVDLRAGDLGHDNESAAVQLELALEERHFADDRVLVFLGAWLLLVFLGLLVLKIELALEGLGQLNDCLCVFNLAIADKASSLVCLRGRRVFQLLDTHILARFAKHSVVDSAKLLHVLLKEFLGDVPSDIPNEQCRVLLAVRCIVLALRLLLDLFFFVLLFSSGVASLLLCLFLGFLLGGLLLGGWWLCLFLFLLLLNGFCLGDLVLFVDLLDAFGFDDFLLTLVRVVDYVLHLRLVAILRQGELTTQRSTFELSAVHGCECFLGLSLLSELYEGEPTVLVIGLVKGHLNTNDLSEACEGFLKMLLPHVEN